METINNNQKKSVGFKGEMFVLDKLKTMGFELYGKNIKSIDSEIDLVVYRYNKEKYTLDIRVIEVKTRNKYILDLVNFNLLKKWRLVRKHIFPIKAEIDKKFDVLNYSEIHFDLALVKYQNESYDLYRYIKDANLML